MKRVCLDTNLLMNDIDLNLFETVYLPSVVLEELDKHKECSDNERAFKARRASRKIKTAKNIGFASEFETDLPSWLNLSKNDNMILAITKKLQLVDDSVIFLTADLNLYYKAKALDLTCEWFECGNKSIDDYTGWKEVIGDTDLINEYYQDIDNGKITFITNEYLITYNTDLQEYTEQRFDGEKFVVLGLPPSKVVKGLNSQQRCALDLLHNKDIPIKIITGKHGSGKTLLTTKVALHHVVDKENYKCLLFLRNPNPSDGTDIGYLKGTKEEKIHEYMQPLLQYIESEKNQGYAEMLIKNEKVRLDVVSFLKGVNIEDTFVMMDEAEDLNTKLIKLVGSRIAKKSCIVFTGDYKQAESKYKSDNGLVKLIAETRGNPLVGIVNLPEDLRSEASKVFADL